MTKSELQVALAAATETNKRITGVFLDRLGDLVVSRGNPRCFGKLANASGIEPDDPYLIS
jgi:hypothetical protein